MSLPLPPQRRITASTPPARQAGRHGVRAVSTLECGHVVETIADARRRGWCFCFACLKESDGIEPSPQAVLPDDTGAEKI